MSEQAKQIVETHTLDVDGCCTGCRRWWGRLSPYPCTQVEWATRALAHDMTERFLAMAGRR